MGLSSPNIVVSNTANDIVQLLALTNAVGNELLTTCEWQQATKIYTFTLATTSLTGTTTSGSAVVTGISSTASLAADLWEVSGTGIPTNTSISSVDSSTQVTLSQNATASGSVSLRFTKTKYALPSDWDRPINRTNWDRTNNWELIGPKSAQEWEWMKGGIVATGPRVRYRILGNYFQIWPLQVNTATIAYEYISQYWITATGGTAPTKSSFTADTDTCIFRDRLMIAGIKFKYFSIKGFDSTAFEKEFLIEREKAMAQDKGAPTLSLSPTSSNVLISPANVPDGNVYGQ